MWERFFTTSINQGPWQPICASFWHFWLWELVGELWRIESAFLSQCSADYYDLIFIYTELHSFNMLEGNTKVDAFINVAHAWYIRFDTSSFFPTNMSAVVMAQKYSLTFCSIIYLSQAEMADCFSLIVTNNTAQKHQAISVLTVCNLLEKSTVLSSYGTGAAACVCGTILASFIPCILSPWLSVYIWR